MRLILLHIGIFLVLGDIRHPDISDDLSDDDIEDIAKYLDRFE